MASRGRPSSIDKINALTEENEDLKNQVQDLNNKFDVLIAQLQGKKAEQVDQGKLYSEIPPNKYIKVMSLCPNKLNLNTRPHGQGKLFSFERFGEVKRIMYSDLIEINSNHRNFLNAGYYYILDDDVISSESLEEVYSKILTKDKIERILSNQSDAIELFKSANPKQQKIIVTFLTERIANGEPVDFNLVNNIDMALNPTNDPNYTTINMKAQDIKNAFSTDDGNKN